MKIRSSKKAIVASAIGMMMSGLLIVGATELIPTTKDIENEVIDETVYLKESKEAELKAVSRDFVMASVQDTTQVQEESQTTEPETTQEQETQPVVNPQYADKFMVNVTEYLNIRSNADENSEVIGKLYPGSGGNVLEKGDQWTKISSGSVEGYVATEYLLFGNDAEAKANEVGRIQVTIQEDCLRVRKSPNTESGVWGLAEKGNIYTGCNVADGWVQIDYDGVTGYVSLDYATAEFVVGKAISIEEEQAEIKRAAEEQAEKDAAAKKKADEVKAAEKKAAAEKQYVETVKTAEYNVSAEDVYLLACLVHAEAGWEPHEGKLAVANVVLNRLSRGSYGNSLSNVIYARGQFSVAASGRLASILAQGPNSDSVAAAKEAISGVNNVPQYSSFCDMGSASYSNYNSYTVIGSQVFYN